MKTKKKIYHMSEAATGGVWYEKVFLKFFGNFTENHLFWSLFLTKLQAFRPVV